MLRTIDLNRISDFLKIVELGNITRAAEALGEGKAKLSRNLALLEHDLGVQLVYRTTRQFQLTEAGLQFYRETKKQFEEIESSILGVRNRDESIEGKIKITAPEDLGNQIVTPLVSEFKKLHAKTEFELLYTNELLDLVKLGVDIAFRIGNLKDSSLLQKKVGRIELALVSSQNYIEKNGVLEKVEDLALHQTIGFSGVDSNYWNLNTQGNSKKIKIKPTLIANNYTCVLNMALLGHGVALIPLFLAEKHINNNTLVRVLKSWSGGGFPVQVVLPQQKKVPTRIRTFFEFSSKKMSTLLS